jgi:hypothetical protein
MSNLFNKAKDMLSGNKSQDNNYSESSNVGQPDSKMDADFNRNDRPDRVGLGGYGEPQTTSGYGAGRETSGPRSGQVGQTTPAYGDDQTTSGHGAGRTTAGYGAGQSATRTGTDSNIGSHSSKRSNQDDPIAESDAHHQEHGHQGHGAVGYAHMHHEVTTRATQPEGSYDTTTGGIGSHEQSHNSNLLNKADRRVAMPKAEHSEGWKCIVVDIEHK